MRAIDADALKEDLTRFYDNEVTARKLIDEQPTIQPEIVRCKDCYNWDMSWDTDMPNCHFCAVVDNVRHAEEFCSFAERREVTT